MASTLLNLAETLTKNAETKNYVDFHGVRITPAFLEFKNSFEGREYKQTITIQNVGLTKVTVRITHPTSFAYRIKCIRNQNLSPGLSLVKKVSYTHSHANAPSCIIGIYIDQHRLDYYLFANVTPGAITIIPKFIDFGLVDAGVTSKTHVFTIRNEGAKATRFYVDSTTSQQQIVVNPNKGFLYPKQAVSVHVKLISTREGDICNPIWVKCEQPYVISTSGTVIKPKFEPVDSGLSTTFSLLDFPITYVGITSTKTVYIRNYSSCGAMFCLMGEVDGKSFDHKTCESSFEDFKQFNITPKDGVCESKEVKVFQFKFAPQTPKSNQKMKAYYFCIYNICRIRCKYLSESSYVGDVFAEHDFNCRQYSQTWSASMNFDINKEVDTGLLFTNGMDSFSEQVQARQECDCVKFYLHGIAEKPSVTVVPDAFTVADLEIGRREVRVLELKNCSDKLPIIIVYKKVAYLDVEKNTITLQPLKSIEISIYITPQKIGVVESQIYFDLVYYDQPKTSDQYKVIGNVVVPITFEAKSVKNVKLPQINKGIASNYLRETGKFCEEVRFNTNVEKPKTALVSSNLKESSSTLIAFPNDLQRSLRPWRDKPKIKTIFTRIPRYVAPLDSDYELTPLEKELKATNDNYYLMYMRKKAAGLQLARRRSLKAVSEYDFTDENKFMAQDALLRNVRCEEPKEISKEQYFIPLTPTEMNHITIDPMVIHTNQMAAHSRFEFKINITNFNPLAIRIFIRPETTNIYFMEGNRRIIPAMSCVSLPVLFISTSVGYYTTSLDIIVNECGVFVVTLIADICPITLNLSTEKVEFTDEDVHRYIEIINPLNVCTRFSWQMQCKNFKIDPCCGSVPANNSLLCHIMYLPHQDGALTVEVDFLVCDKIFHQIKLLVNTGCTTLRFLPSELIFLNNPLNIPLSQRVVLENDGESSKGFCLVESKFLKYVQVVPSEGVIHGKSYVVITITLTLASCVTFNTSLNFRVTGSAVIELPLSGNIVYPEVQVTPTVIKFQKIPASTHDVSRFNIENKSKAMVSVKFDMVMYNEYKITEGKNYWESQALHELILDKQSSKQLFIHFLPRAAVSDKFFLPMVVNNSLGPVISDTLATRISSFYVSQGGSTTVSVPHNIPATKINSYATQPKLCFSKFTVRLDFKHPPFKCNSNYELKITNSQKETEDFCIRTEDLHQYFTITYLRGKDIIRHEQSIVCSLSWKEEVVLNISFQPIESGIFKSALSVYFRSDMSAQPHNTLYIEGTFLSPTIVCLNPISYYKPVPLHVNVTTVRRLRFENHYGNCCVLSYTDIRDQKIETVDSPPDANNTRVVVLKLFFRNEKSRRFICNLTILCTCGSRYDTPLYGIAENCFLSTYALVNTYIGNACYNLELCKKESFDTLNRPSFMSILDAPQKLIEEYDLSNFFVSFPFFPSHSDDEDEDDFADFMDTCVSVAEKWIYTQCFFGRSFYKIPEGINFVMWDAVPQKTPKSNATRGKLPPFIQLLLNLAGKQFYKLLNPISIPSDETGRAIYVYGLYAKAVQFLCDLGAYFTYIAPEFMMDYQMYCVYMQSLSPEARARSDIKIANGDEFYKIAKQSWLDVILQTYKVLMLTRLIVGHKGVVNITKVKSTPEEKFRSSVKNVSKNNHLFSTTELLLLNWLEFHYNEIRTTVWIHNTTLGPREITLFGDTMADGFVYASITLTYCPYLKDHFNELYPDAVNHEEILHNNIKVIEAWNILNFSLDITVQDLARPHSLRTLFIIVYLYEVLPSMYPSESLEFCVGLSERMSKVLVIKNHNDFTVAYKAILYQNNGDCFETNRDFYVVEAKSKCTVQITYWAKFIMQNQCTLILSGECKGYFYAKSTVVTLVGSPDLSYVTETIDLPVSLYKVIEISLNCRSPYNVKSVHTLQFTSLACTKAAEVNALPTHRDYPKYYISRLCPVKTEIEFDEEGAGSVDCILICLTARTVPVWIYFRNPTVGDFVIKVFTVYTSFIDKEILDVTVPRTKGKCSSRKEIELILEIPCQNRLLWRAIMTGFLKVCTHDSMFWRKQIYTVTGTHIAQQIMRPFANAPGHDADLWKVPAYKIETPKNSVIKLPDTVSIVDECSSDCVKISMILGDIRKLPNDFYIDLESLDGTRKRSYYINFIVEQSDAEMQISDNQ